VRRHHQRWRQRRWRQRRRPRRRQQQFQTENNTTIVPIFQSGSTCKGIHSEERKGRKSLFLFTATTFKKNESGSDFQRIQIWNDRSQKLANALATVLAFALALTFFSHSLPYPHPRPSTPPATNLSTVAFHRIDPTEEYIKYLKQNKTKI
jgi:hypothetical protein